jgi:hypothetical protein
MLNASRIGSTLASKAALLVVTLCACSSAKSPDSGIRVDVGGAQGTSRSSAGIAGAASGQTAAIGAVAGATAAATGAPSGSSGSSGSVARSGNAAGASGVTAEAGTGAQAGVAGTTGIGGSGGRAGAAPGTGGSGGAAGSTATATGCDVSPISADMRSHYQNMNDPYYQKYASANGVIVATGTKVGDEALVRYCRLLTEMLSNDKVRKSIISQKMWFTMIAQSEQLSSLPQINMQYGTSLNARARGLGGLTPTICAEDSIMCMRGDPWNGDCICPHETGHTLYSSGIMTVPELSSRLTAITNSTRSSGRLANSYVWQDGDESGMMAWGVQAWYNCAINGTNGAYHSDINTRAELQKEMPDFYQFLSELLPTENQYKDCYAK